MLFLTKLISSCLFLFIILLMFYLVLKKTLSLNWLVEHKLLLLQFKKKYSLTKNYLTTICLLKVLSLMKVLNKVVLLHFYQKIWIHSLYKLKWHNSHVFWVMSVSYPNRMLPDSFLRYFKPI